jgi:hypothetical protein
MDENVLSVIKNSFTDISNDNVEKFIAAAESMTKRFISLKETKVSSRNFNHWKEEGLIDYNTNEKRVKLTLFEYIWVKTISTMRNFGVSISIIKSIKKYMNTDVYRYLISVKEENSTAEFEKIIGNFTKSKQEKEQIIFLLANYDNISDEDMLPFPSTLFNYSILNCLISRERADIIVLEGGESFLLLDSTYGFIKSTYGDETANGFDKILEAPHLKMNLNYLLYEFLKEEKRADYIVNKHIFSNSELLLIKLLRKNNTLKVEITKEKKGEVYKIDITEENKPIAEDKLDIIQKIIGLGKYQSINLRMDDNKMFVKRKITTKVNG